MKNLMVVLFLQLMVVSLIAQSTSGANGEEPRAQFILSVNGIDHVLYEGQQLRLDTTLVNPEFTIKTPSFISFENSDIAFDYPKNFGYEFEGEPGYKNWTFDGNDFVIMIFEFDVLVDTDAFVEDMVSRFGKKNCRVEDTQVQLGARSLKGQRINVNLIGEMLSVDFLELINSDNKSSFIAFQDTKEDDGAASAESVKALKLISKTIQYK